MASNNNLPPYGHGVYGSSPFPVSAGSFGNVKSTPPDFIFSTSISDSVRKYEPKQFYLLIEMLCNHIENFKGEFPGYPNLSYEVVVDPSTSQNQVTYKVIFTREEKNNDS